MKAKADQALREETPNALGIANTALLVSELLDDPRCYALSLWAKAQVLHLLANFNSAMSRKGSIHVYQNWISVAHGIR